MTTSYQIIYWRDIPAQVKAKAGRERSGRQLAKRFGVAIDEAAMRAGLTGSDDYLGQWRTGEAQEREGDPAEVAAAVAAEVEAAYPPERVQRLVAQLGLEQAAP